MEARNFVSAREMAEHGEWLIPTLNEEIRIRKPPLPVWLTAISISIADEPNNLWALRLPAALIALLAIVFLYYLLTSLDINKDASLLSALVLLSSYLFIEIGRTGSWDIFAISFMVGGLLFMVKALKENRLLFYLLSGLFLGLSFNSKGPVAVYTLFLPFLLALFFTHKKLITQTSKKGVFLMVITFLVLSALWPLYIYLSIPDIASQILNEEATAWFDRHNRPPWFYLHFPIFFGVWIIVALSVLFKPFTLTKYIERNKIIQFLLWFVFALVLLSIVPEKKERYFLPAMIPLAILIGISIYSQIQESRRKGFFEKISKVQNGFLIIVCPVLLFLFYKFGYQVDKDLIYLSFIGILLVVFATLFIVQLKKRQTINFYSTLFLFVGVFSGLSFSMVNQMKMKNTQYENLTLLQSNPQINNLPYYSDIDDLNPIQIWEAGKSVISIDKYKGELIYLLLTKDKQIAQEMSLIHTFYYNPKNETQVIFVYLINKEK